MTKNEKYLADTMSGLAQNIAGLTGSLAAITELFAQRIQNLSEDERNFLLKQSQNLLETEKQIASVSQILKDVQMD